MNKKKLKVIFVNSDTELDQAVSNALLTQLMVKVVQIGTSIEDSKKDCSTIRKEN